MTEDKKGMEELARMEPSDGAERAQLHSGEPEVEGHMRPRSGPSEETPMRARRPANGPERAS